MFAGWIVAGFTASAAHAAGPQARDGVLDLRGVHLAGYGLVALEGEWHFYEHTFLMPDQLPSTGPSEHREQLGQPKQLGQPGHRVIHAPATWGSQPLSMGDHGYGTYRLTVVLAEEDVGRTLGLRIPSIASAHELYINGKKAASAGRTGVSAREMTPAALPQTIYFTPETAEVELVLHVSNFSQRKGGIWSALKLGTSENVSKEVQQRLIFQTFIAAGLLLMGIFHAGFYFIRAKTSSLFFGLACLLLFLRSVFTGEFLANRLVPAIPWELGVKMEYLGVFWGISFLLLYFDRLYPGNLNRKLSLGLALGMMAVTLPVLALPARIYTEWMIVCMIAALAPIFYIVSGLVRAAARRLPGARINVAAGLLFLLAALNDILYYNFVFRSIDLVALGLFLFIFTQMFMLARKFAAAFREAERLRDELEATNTNLENIVGERTRALRQSNEKLRQSEQARSDLLGEIIHELRNPLTSVIGYLRRVKDGASGEDRRMMEKHIDVAYRKAQLLEHVVDDLRQLAHLGQDRMAYSFQPVEMETFRQTLELSYDWEFLDRQVEFAWKAPEEAAKQLVLQIDLQRMEQVFANLVNNALNHTGPDDRITITGRYFAFARACVVSVRDTGTGIDEKDRPHIFERYYRAARIGGDSRGLTGGISGSGLGLTIAKAIMEAHRGRIGMRSEPGAGSVFYLILPVGRRA
jgi:signal transduction histidine kinase